MPDPTQVYEIPFERLERMRRIASLGSTPAVGRLNIESGGYYITVRMPASAEFDCFYTLADGTITSAPDVPNPNYQPGKTRITGLDKAVVKYAGGAR